MLALALVAVSQTLNSPATKGSFLMSFKNSGRENALVIAILLIVAMVILNPGTEGAAWYGVLVIMSIISSAIAIAPTPIRNITSKDQLKKYRVSVEKFKKHLSNILGNGKISFFNTSYGILTLESASTSLEKRTPSNDDMQLLAYGNLKIAHSEDTIVPTVVASSTLGIHIAISHVYSVTELSDKLVNFKNDEILNKKNDNEEVT